MSVELIIIYVCKKTSSSHIADLKFLPYPDINYSCLSLISREFLLILISSLRINHSCLSFISREFLLQPDVKSENQLFLSITYI